MSNFIIDVIKKHYPEQADSIYKNSYLLQYLDKKTKSVNRSSKARGSFANIYAIYVLTDDYIKKGYFAAKNTYCNYDGMSFTAALAQTRSLPFGEKLQNHALNDRCNDEFKKFFNSFTEEVPIIRNLTTKKYWINEKLLIVKAANQNINIAQICVDVINQYISLKQENFAKFFSELLQQKEIVKSNPQDSINFILSTISPNSDARIFEIASYVIIKWFYIKHKVTFSIDNGKEKTAPLTVYKIGRTNANDGGIDYIMQPLGRIFQVTEVLDFKKYFLDIGKLIYYPITFVIKQNITPKEAFKKIKEDAEKVVPETVLPFYLNCFEEIITIPTLRQMLETNIYNEQLEPMINEYITQCKVEYNLNN